uniref:non-specific serine/threonine protein kinase n=1 Tax=Brugia malayi TaxID=6279 RepID=A0A0H5S855_BRUMA|nr:Bm10121 [Brugia malayi]
MVQKPIKYNGVLILTDEPEDFRAEELEEDKEIEPFLPVESFSHSEKFLLQLINSQFTILHKSVSEGRLLGNLMPYDDSKDNRPFYLRESFPWTTNYATKRNYLKELLHICSQPQIMRWRKVKKVLNVSEAKKIAEGVYCEIFLAEYKMETVILKLIPIGDDDDQPIGGCYISSFRDGVAKLIVLKEIADLCQVKQGYSTEGFVQLKGAMVVKGLYPSSMIYAWREYKQNGKSDKLNPNLFPANQSFLLLFAEHGGTSLKEYKITTILQAYSIVYQLFMALAVAEFRLSFEHRDLNCENILITSVDCIDTIRSKFDGSEVYIYAHGARVKIINSSFCRMTKGTSTIYFDWASNEEFFMGEGDFEHIAFQTMRRISKNIWRPFRSITNVLWLAYIIDFIHDQLKKSNVGSTEERTAFFLHFKCLHRYASAWKWVRDHIDSHMKKDVIEKEEPQKA